MPRPIHFEIHAADPERAQRFYGALFGWSFTPVEAMLAGRAETDAPRRNTACPEPAARPLQRGGIAAQGLVEFSSMRPVLTARPALQRRASAPS